MTTDVRAALLVIGEPGADPAAALSMPGDFAARFYFAADGASGPQRAVEPLPDGVVSLRTIPGGRDASSGALDAVRRTGWRQAILVISAGERMKESGGARGGPHRTCAAYRVAIRLAHGHVRHIPWFHGRRPSFVAGPGSTAAPPRVTFARYPGDLGEVTRSLVGHARLAPLPAGRVGAPRLLVAPLLRSVRVFASGGWKDGFRGALFSMLHGLLQLIVLTRAWRAREAGVAGGPK